MARTDLTIRGAAEMERLMKELGPRIAGRIADTALRSGARIIAARAKQLAPQPGEGEATGELRNSITSRVLKQRRQDERAAVVGFERPTSRRAHLTEFGTAHAAAHPFITPAFDEKAGAALDKIGEVLGKGIEREAEKMARRG